MRRAVLQVASSAGRFRVGARGFSTSTLADSFQPPPPNSYHGTPVYEDIGITGPSPPEDSPSARRNADPDAVHVVTGASRGMGLQYVKSLITRTEGTIIATCRNPDGTSELHEFLASSAPEVLERIKVLPLDVTEQHQIEQLAKEIEETHNRVDSLFNVAGVLGDPSVDPGPERNLAMLDASWLEKQMKVNAIGPLMISKALAPLMKAKKGRKMLRPAETVIVNMSARVASIADNTGPLGWHSYRMSKCALNMGNRTISHELKRQGTWTIALYPGMTDTDMSKPFQKAVKPGHVFPVSFTVKRMLDVVEGMEEKHTGGLYDWAGQALSF